MTQQHPAPRPGAASTAPRRVTRRAFTAGSTGLAATAALAACGGGDDTGSEAATLQFFLSGDTSQGGGFAAMAAKYGEETGTRVEVVDIAYDDLTTRLRNAARGGSLPALARVTGLDPVWTPLLADLTDVREAADIDPELIQEDEDGLVTALPTDLTAVGLFINETLFDQAGVTWPQDASQLWTWPEFNDALRQVQAATGARYGLVVDRSTHRLNAFLFQNGSNGFVAQDGVHSADAQLVPALELFKSMNDDSLVPRSVWLSGDDPNALFKSGQVAAYYSGSWQVADFAENITDFEWASVLMPASPVRSTNLGGGYVVVFAGDAQDAAHDFVSWLYEPENYRELSETSGFLPVVEGMEITYPTRQEAYDLYNAEIAASDPIAAQSIRNGLKTSYEGKVTEGDPVRDNVVKYLNDEQSVQVTVDTIIETLNEQLA
ncbi:ABC transporter substrate-binding protein [Kineococcus arenarius]|uniref:ABC transporter substrate-binding protein n=1 Tax=unclassified Kineococcus TaxID=2621656 RepID=UPI003D7E21A7